MKEHSQVSVVARLAHIPEVILCPVRECRMRASNSGTFSKTLADRQNRGRLDRCAAAAAAARYRVTSITLSSCRSSNRLIWLRLVNIELLLTASTMPRPIGMCCGVTFSICHRYFAF
jgi:hypothetical protein